MNTESNTTRVTDSEVEWMEVPMMGAGAGGDHAKYEISWRDGTRLMVPRGFCAEELTILVELLRVADAER